MKSGWLSIGLLLAAGCTTAQVQAVRHTATGIEPQEAVAILFSPQFSLDARPVEEKEIVNCINDAVRTARPSLRIVPTDEFRRTAFPDLSPEAAPNSPEYLGQLLTDPAFRARIAPLGLRYLISIQGGTKQQGEPIGGIIGGMGAAVTVFGASWNRKSNLTASLLDLKQVAGAGQIHASAEGKPWFLCIGIGPLCAPIGVPAFTEGKACKELGQALAKFLAGEGPPEPEEDQK